MKCWKCGNEIPENSLYCTYCSCSQTERKNPKTEEGKALRRIYDRFGCKQVLNNMSYLSNAIGDLLEDSRKLKNYINMSNDAGIGKLYLNQLAERGNADSTFYGKIRLILSEDVGLSDKITNDLICYFDEMIGWESSVYVKQNDIKNNTQNNIQNNLHTSHSNTHQNYTGQSDTNQSNTSGKTLKMNPIIKQVTNSYDLRTDVTISFAESITGTIANLELEIDRKKYNVEINIPAGIDSGQSIRLRDFGLLDPKSGKRGNLLVTIHVCSHPEFKRNGYDIFSSVKISYDQSVYGTRVYVNTLEGPLELNIPPKTINNTNIILRGKGVPHLNDESKRGDHYIKVLVDENLSKKKIW